ncbi:AbrB/MazE/SpoVT family DNA-binding domain-containing protein [Clostridium sporogenes]|uniref:AbrB/MazE/SpoVT family DNA-binding domain-containing protein n=1 Tax=Clostridium sporogenes TaxID=1509 RepID=UPI001C11729D|nr:AbrB/MazE/SpoVT family DNA-binding domain-containing protein [Clostridium sporogenes]
MNKKAWEDKYMGSVKVGPKGQIVIPKEVRDMFNISSGDTLILLADAKKGIAIERYEIFSKIADAIFAGKAQEIYPSESEEDSLIFAKEIKKFSESEGEHDE